MAEVKAEQQKKESGKYGETPTKPHKAPETEEEDEENGGSEPSAGSTLDISASVGFKEGYKNKKKDVKALQAALVKLGYNIKVNGKLGMHRNSKKKLKGDLKSGGKETITAIHSSLTLTS